MTTTMSKILKKKPQNPRDQLTGKCQRACDQAFPPANILTSDQFAAFIRCIREAL